MATTGFFFSKDRPAANVTECCSAMATSKYLSGYFWLKSTSPEPSRIAGVIATKVSSFSAISTIQSLKIS